MRVKRGSSIRFRPTIGTHFEVLLSKEPITRTFLEPRPDPGESVSQGSLNVVVIGFCWM